jgi:hypothetical protein
MCLDDYRSRGYILVRIFDSTRRGVKSVMGFDSSRDIVICGDISDHRYPMNKINFAHRGMH